MRWFAIAILLTSVISAYADYKCICSYSVETNVYFKPTVQGDILGYMYEFDCKPQEGHSDNNWITVAYEHQISTFCELQTECLNVSQLGRLGYIEKSDQLQVQTCQGNIPDEDKLAPTTTMKPTLTTTLEPTTTEALTTTTEKVTSTSSTASTTTTKRTTSETTPTPTTTTERLTTPTTTTERLTTPTTTTGRLTTPTTTTEEPSTIMLINVTTTEKPTTASPATLSTQGTSTSKPVQSTPSVASTTQTWTTTNVPIPSANTIQGHLELCSSRIQQAAKRDGAILAQFGDNCYEVDQSSVSWSHAERICVNNGGHLAHISNQKEQDFIYNFLVKHHSHTAWIGLHDRNSEEHFEWTSGDAVGYTNWKSGRKNNFFHGSEDCVYMSPVTGEWDDIQCGGNNFISEIFQGHSYICQFATVTASTTFNPTLDGNLNMCSNHLRRQSSNDAGTLAQYGHSCYEVVPHTQKTWNQAESFCHSRGGHLAHISNAQEQSFILGFMQRYSPQHAVWIGLTDSHSEGHFHWTSGNSVQYTNWVPGHISNFVHHNQEDCVAFIPYKNGQWDDIPCGNEVSTNYHVHTIGEVHPVLCQYSTSSGPSFVG